MTATALRRILIRNRVLLLAISFLLATIAVVLAVAAVRTGTSSGASGQFFYHGSAATPLFFYHG